MKKSMRSKSQLSGAAKLKRTRDTAPEERPPTKTNASRRPSKRCKISEGTPSPQPENITGLAIFPDELLLEILSYYPDSKPEPNVEYSGMDAEAHFARRERLIALSQTCRNLRRFLRPYLWSRVEVFRGMRVSAGEVLNTKKRLALELIRQLEIVTIRDPTLAGYVNVVNVTIGNHCVKNVLRELARCLAMFPNLHTFRLDHWDITLHWEQDIMYGFGRDASFPQVRSIAISKDSVALLRYFPGAWRDIHYLNSRRA